MGTCLARVLQAVCSWFAGSQQQQNDTPYSFCEKMQSVSLLTFRNEFRNVQKCLQRNSLTTNSVNDEHLPMFKYYTTRAILKYRNSFHDLIRNTSPLISVLQSGQIESRCETLCRKCDIFYLNAIFK